MVFIFFINCASAKSDLKFSTVKYPVSLSPYLYGPNWEKLQAGKQLTSVSKFFYKQSYYSILYGWLPLSSEKKFNEYINQKIKEKNAKGMVNLSISSQMCGINNIIILNILPVWPGCTIMTAQGEIVQ